MTLSWLSVMNKLIKTVAGVNTFVAIDKPSISMIFYYLYLHKYWLAYVSYLPFMTYSVSK